MMVVFEWVKVSLNPPLRIHGFFLIVIAFANIFGNCEQILSLLSEIIDNAHPTAMVEEIAYMPTTSPSLE